MSNNFFKHNDKVYSENLNDGILVGNAFNFEVPVSLPDDTGGVFPNSGGVKAKVCDVTPTANSNLSIGETVSNTSGGSQDYRLTVYPNFNRYGGFESISVDASSGVTFKICEKGSSSEIASGLDYSDLSNVQELKQLSEYDIVVTIPNNKTLAGLNFTLLSTEKDINADFGIELVYNDTTGELTLNQNF